MIRRLSALACLALLAPPQAMAHHTESTYDEGLAVVFSSQSSTGSLRFCITIDLRQVAPGFGHLDMEIDWGDGTSKTWAFYWDGRWPEAIDTGGCHDYAPSLVPYAVEASVADHGGRRVTYEDRWPLDPTPDACARMPTWSLSDQCRSSTEQPCEEHFADPSECYHLVSDPIGFVLWVFDNSSEDILTAVWRTVDRWV